MPSTSGQASGSRWGTVLAMRALYPNPGADVDVYDAYRPDDPTGPLVRLNMVVSLDGSVTDQEGRSGGLGGHADRAVFGALRAHADAILVGAGTARAERYGPHRLSDNLAERRRSEGRAGPATVVVVSRSLDLDPNAPLFTDARARTVVMTCASSPMDRRDALSAAADVLIAGDERVDLTQGLRLLRERGAAHVLCEGGPSLNAGLFAQGLVDEVCLTVAPVLMGTGGPRLTEGLPTPVPLRLLAALEGDGDLLLRYRC
jgi:riboflavin-specific deaminase-like protein